MQGIHSNLECFLEHTTPTVLCSHHSLIKEFRTERAGDGMRRTEECMPFFNMGDLWRSFEEWSAYGAGVPLVLPCGDTIVQYYVPYLSALQIYTQQPRRAFLSKLRGACDESEWRNTWGSSIDRASSDVEIDKASPSIKGEMGKIELHERKEVATDEKHHGHLVFEYFEKSSPYGRAPLKDKISELGGIWPLLFSLHSHELSSSSWFSVAWYPIYRIPIGPTMEDLSTCFLSFHSLWTPFTLEEGELWCDHLNKPKNGICEPCNISTLHVQDDLAWRRKECERVMRLPTFGLASYKLEGPFWAYPALDDKRKIFSLATCAISWLRQLRVQHPDFEFFRSRH